MKIVFADTFAKSLRKIAVHERWYWKIIDLFRYDLPRFFRNVWDFRNELWNNYSFDSRGGLLMLKRSLERTADVLEFHGMEVEIYRMKKVAKMRRAIELLDLCVNDKFLEVAEKQLGKEVDTRLTFQPCEKSNFIELKRIGSEDNEKSNAEIFELARTLEIDSWNELFTILKGQDINEFKKIEESLSAEERRDDAYWDNWYDGSGILGWWD